LGADAYSKIEEQLNRITKELNQWREMGSATGFD
jgi:hypothetical protein